MEARHAQRYAEQHARWLIINATRLAQVCLLAAYCGLAAFDSPAVGRAIHVYCLLDADCCLLELFAPGVVARRLSPGWRVAKECGSAAGGLMLVALVVACEYPTVARVFVLVCLVSVASSAIFMAGMAATAGAVAVLAAAGASNAAGQQHAMRRQRATQRLRQRLAEIAHMRLPDDSSAARVTRRLHILIDRCEQVQRLFARYLDMPSGARLRQELVSVLPGMAGVLWPMPDQDLHRFCGERCAELARLHDARQEYLDALQGVSYFRAWLRVRC